MPFDGPGGMSSSESPRNRFWGRKKRQWDEIAGIEKVRGMRSVKQNGK